MNIRAAVNKANHVKKYSIYFVAISLVLFVAALLFRENGTVSTIFIILSSLLSLVLIFPAAVNDVEKRIYLSDNLIIMVASMIFIIIGYRYEGAAAMLFFNLYRLLYNYSLNGTFSFFSECESGFDTDGLLAKSNSGLFSSLSSCFKLYRIAALVLAALFATLFPIVTSLSYKNALHRAFIFLILASPTSALVTVSIAENVSCRLLALKGCTVNNIDGFINSCKYRTLAIDKDCVSNSTSFKLYSVVPAIIDKKTFMNFAAHAAYYSDQLFADLIVTSYDDDIREELISSFKDYPGEGITADIGGVKVLFGTSAFMNSRGVDVSGSPANDIDGLICYYLNAAGKNVGYVAFYESKESRFEPETVGIIKNSLNVDCVLLSDANESVSLSVADKYGFENSYDSCDTDKKNQIIEKLSENGMVCYAFNKPQLIHSQAAADIITGNKSKSADIALSGNSFVDIIYLIKLSGKLNRIVKENVIFAAIIKALCVFLTMTGHCTGWFAVMLDYTALILSVLNLSRLV